MKLTELIKTKRQQAGLSLRDLADAAGCSAMLLSLWERGKSKIGKTYLLKIAKELKISKKEIASWTGTSGTVNLEKAFELNDKEKIAEFIDQVSEKRISTATWDDILDLLAGSKKKK